MAFERSVRLRMVLPEGAVCTPAHPDPDADLHPHSEQVGDYGYHWCPCCEKVLD